MKTKVLLTACIIGLAALAGALQALSAPRTRAAADGKEQKGKP